MTLRGAWAAALSVTLAGCGLLAPAPNPLIPGSQWRVTAIDGEPVVGTEVILTVLADSVTLSSSCGASIGEIAQNDDQGFSLAELEGPGERPMCPPAAARTHGLVADALATVEGWTVLGDVTELRGAQTLRLEPQHTDS